MVGDSSASRGRDADDDADWSVSERLSSLEGAVVRGGEPER